MQMTGHLYTQRGGGPDISQGDGEATGVRLDSSSCQISRRGDRGDNGDSANINDNANDKAEHGDRADYGDRSDYGDREHESSIISAGEVASFLRLS